VARTDDFQNLARDIALHIASMKPLAVTKEEMPKDAVEREREVFRAQAEESGKPEQVWDKIVEGRLRKYYEQAVLLEQPYVKDDSKTVGELVKEMSGKLGENLIVRRFARLELGAE
jgi:elongation factor Ts